ncbi:MULTISPECIES: DUF4349 domain-containing protein [unclassified Microbacterium]|uniref:DUF4349 domain-containing protein n=1 Tax=unclassified Microbacterium TaxID=2609290 RepID=UPI0012F9D776|nr:DUF4349 domain-containing protein [Microbacterium sp. MAH-37]MVQ42561.1 DUF4349 domain-containing protein [Microbacterium sp. MAH-37]
MNRMRRGLVTVVLLSALMIGTAGCTAMGGSSGGSSGDSSSSEVQSGQDAGGAADDQAPGAVEDKDSAVVTTGRMLLTTDDPLAAADDATKIAVDAGGRVDARNDNAGGDGAAAQAEVVLRIPADDLEDARAALKKLGELEETSFSAEEVGATQRDLDARITTLRTSIARYTEWLGTAQKTSDLIELEQAISERQSELESLTAQKRDLDDRVAMATVTVTFMSVYVPQTTAPQNPLEAIAAGWSAFVSFWSATGIALAFLLPWLVVVAVIVLVVLWIVRRRRGSASAPAPAAEAGAAADAGAPAASAPAPAGAPAESQEQHDAPR